MPNPCYSAKHQRLQTRLGIPMAACDVLIVGSRLTLRCVHPSLGDCVGQATAAFALEVLRGRIIGQQVHPESQRECGSRLS